MGKISVVSVEGISKVEFEKQSVLLGDYLQKLKDTPDSKECLRDLVSSDDWYSGYENSDLKFYDLSGKTEQEISSWKTNKTNKVRRITYNKQEVDKCIVSPNSFVSRAALNRQIINQHIGYGTGLGLLSMGILAKKLFRFFGK